MANIVRQKWRYQVTTIQTAGILVTALLGAASFFQNRFLEKEVSKHSDGLDTLRTSQKDLNTNQKQLETNQKQLETNQEQHTSSLKILQTDVRKILKGFEEVDKQLLETRRNMEEMEKA
ncbi:hypothetical protein LTR84_004786 [Exophiala bonariae]|uniref:Uncharacterized protein n=1 Tax=Exophiala bonariae TaxID=1690606 RepID=A0AAV9NRS2_9EURO|nr:hypothetical protein LTR84_004786 [Exophiala bonariae]